MSYPYKCWVRLVNVNELPELSIMVDRDGFLTVTQGIGTLSTQASQEVWRECAKLPDKKTHAICSYKNLSYITT